MLLSRGSFSLRLNMKEVFYLRWCISFVHGKKWKKNYQSGDTFSLNENLNYSEATSKMGKMSRDKLPVEKGMYNDAFSFTLFPSLC